MCYWKCDIRFGKERQSRYISFAEIIEGVKCCRYQLVTIDLIYVENPLQLLYPRDQAFRMRARTLKVL